jgi:hypothetical protein
MDPFVVSLAFGPENSKSVSDCGLADSITLAETIAHFMPTMPTRTIFLINLG